MGETGDKDVDTTVPVTSEQSPHQSEGGEEERILTKTRLYVVVFGVFCAMVAGTAIYMGIKTTEHQESIKHLTTETQNLMERRMTLNEDIKYLTEEKDKRCELCPLGWILYKGKCYLFHDTPPRWKTWEESQRFCEIRRSHLVVIDDLEEQEFVNRNILFYYDKSHGYWMGLQEVNNTWTWLDGRADTLGFWAKKWISAVGPYALVLPDQNPNNCWSKEQNVFRNKCICERDTRKI